MQKYAYIINVFLTHTIHSPYYYERRTKAVTDEGLNMYILRAGSFGPGTYCVRPPKDGPELKMPHYTRRA